jgi:hypothetical protein
VAEAQFHNGVMEGWRNHRCGDAWWWSLSGRQLGVASGGLSASLDLTAAHSGWKRVEGVGAELLMVGWRGSGRRHAGDRSSRRLDSRQRWRERKGGRHSCGVNLRGNGSGEGGRVVSP